MRRLLITIAGICAGLILLLVVLLHTGTGLNLVLAFLPGQITVQSADGTLAGTVSLSDVEFNADGLALQIQKVDLDLAPYALLRGKVYINSLILDSVRIVTTGTESSSATTGTDPVGLPLGFNMEDMRINGLEWQTEGQQTATNVSSLQLSAYTVDQTIHIESLTVDSDKIDLDAGGLITLGDVYSYQLTAGLDYIIDEQHSLSADLQLTGDTGETDLTAEIRTPSIIQIEMQLSDLLDTPHWQGTINTDEFNIADVTDQIAPHIVSVNLNSSGTPANTRFEGSVQSYGGPQPDITDLSGNPPAVALGQVDLAIKLEASGLDSDTPALNGSVSWTDLSIQQTAGTQRQLALEAGILDVDYEDSSYRFELNTDLLLDELIHGSLTGRGHGTREAVYLDDFGLALEQGQLQGTAALEQQQDNYRLKAGVSWQQFTLPLSPEQTLFMDDGLLRLTGSTDRYTVEMESSLALNTLPPVQLNMTANGNLQGAELANMTLVSTQGAGQLSASGQIGWTDVPMAELTITGNNINPGVYLPEWTGDLVLDAKINARGPADDYQVTIPNLSLNGQLVDHKLALELVSRLTPENVEISRANLVSGPNRFMLSGNWGTASSLEWSIDAPELNTLHTDIQGNLNATGTLGGSLDNLKLKMVLQGEQLDTPWGSLAMLESTATIDQAGQDLLDISLSAKDLEYQGRLLDSVRLTAEGSMASQDYNLTIAGEPLTLTIDGTGAYRDHAWTGRTDRLELTLLEQTWNIRSAFDTAVSDRGIAITDLCLTHEITALCVQGHYADNEHWQTDIAVSGISLAAASPYLPPAVSISGSSRLDIKGKREGAELPQLNGSLVSNGANIRFQIDRNTTQEFQIESINGEFTLDKGMLDSQLLLVPADEQLERLQASLTLGPINTLQPDLNGMDMNGEIKWTVRDLSFISTLSNQLTDVNGELLLDLGFSGIVTEPVLSGEISLRDGGMMFPEYGIELTELQVKGQPLKGNGFQLKGSAASGTGTLGFKADLTPEAPEQWLAAGIKGSDFEAMNTPEIRAKASTDLDLSVGRTSTRVQGNLDIHDAVIDLDEMRESVTLSDDVVMADDESTGKEAVRSVVDLSIHLNENIRIEGQGISGQLSGQLDIDSTDKGDLLGNGEIRITDGQYKAYGQDLSIEEGRILYRNTPLGNPELRVRAVRRINDDVTAGLIVSGLLSNPQVTLMSTPSMSDEDILAYIVFGRPLSSLDSGEGTDLIGAATALGIKNSGGLTRSLSSTFGLDQVELTSGAGGDNAALTVGKFITPKLYISYIVGLMESFSTARIQYTLTDSWSLEAKSGESVGVDILYTIEK